MNYVRVGTYLSLFYTALLLIFMVYAPGIPDSGMYDFQSSVTTAMWAGQIPLFLVGVGLAHLRLRFFNVIVVNRFL